MQYDNQHSDGGTNCAQTFLTAVTHNFLTFISTMYVVRNEGLHILCTYITFTKYPYDSLN